MSQKPIAYAVDDAGECRVWARRDPEQQVRSLLESQGWRVHGPFADVRLPATHFYQVNDVAGRAVSLEQANAAIEACPDIDFQEPTS